MTMATMDLAEMEAMEKDTGTFNGSSDDLDEAAAALPRMRRSRPKNEKKQAKKLGITVEELEKREAEGGDLSEPEGIDISSEASSDPSAARATAATEKPTKKKKLTAEERIRKDRPPPRIRIMESSQPDYTALRLENIAITFRDQPVLTSATWGVQAGDRIGLVGANRAGKTTQLRILTGELEPTAGDVVKSRKDLRVAMLRQEFIDEIDPTRSLRDEFMSVFTEEAQIMADLASAEKELEGMTGGEDDADRMQEVLDLMAKL
mmetsp:Transcript_29250/g.53617  ORF Transcript_29250/g.53617 Transcript_29250/m.53617 type:complete len:263 (-) Transcript_29250:251-1039(-)